METFEAVGALHVHTALSDGRGSLGKLALAAAEAHVDFVLVSDHNVMAPAGQYGWREGVFLWRGLERSSVRGREHFLVAGLDEPPPERTTTPQALAWAKAHGGWTAASHPEARRTFWGWTRDETLSSWPFWDAPFDAIEIYSYLHAWAADLKPWQVPSAAKRRTETVKNPSPALLRKWDSLAMHRKVVGIGTLDNHARWFPFLGTLFPHREVLGALTTHLLLPSRFSGDDRGDEALLNAVLLSGNAFVARDELAPAKGASFLLERPDAVYHMGERVKPAASSRLVFEVPRPADLRILCNGEIVESVEGAARLETVPRAPGVFRAEAYIHGKAWVLTNHISIVAGKT